MAENGLVTKTVGKTVGKTVDKVNGLGDYLREQRIGSAMSLRQLAEEAGVSNPYLSMVERGLRNPSAQVLKRLAKSLEISAEQLYLRAGVLDVEESHGTVQHAIATDPRLTDAQRRSLLDIYASFVGEDHLAG